MLMNKLIKDISELFEEDDTVQIYTYDDKVIIFGACFGNIEIRKIYRLIQQEQIQIELEANANKKVCIKLTMEK